jgi:hypothetical protein
MDVFFDTEFTTLEKDGMRSLISIGCVAQDGSEFYAELSDTWHPANCSDFVVEHVLPLLNGGESRMKEAELAARLKTWIESLTDKEVIFRSDAPHLDWPFIEATFNAHGWPKNLRQKCGVISFDNDNFQKRFDAALTEYWREHSARRHHALVDARSLLFAKKRAIRRGI